jgi:protein TonB
MREPQRSPELFKPKGQQQQYDIARLYPSAQRLARLEEGYRKKYETEVEEGEAKFLNTQDIQFGSFLRRFETAVYGVWHYPEDAARMGMEGVTAVKITFNRRGEVEHVQLLESSGSKILDDEVLRSLRSIGPMGSFPRGYDKEIFNLIAFFQYGIIKGVSRGSLH